MSLARSSDPSTSHAAAKAVAPSLNRLRRIVLNLIYDHPLCTARELERKAEGLIDPVDTVHKRISELHAHGKIKAAHRRTCTVTGRLAFVWQPTRGAGDGT